MTTFKEIRGKLIRTLDQDPTVPESGQIWYNKTTGVLKTVLTEFSFSSGGSMPVARDFGTGGGATQNASWVAGGENGATVLNSTVEYNGSTWTTSGNMGTARIRMALGNCGTQTAGIGSGGFIAPPSPIQSVVEEYDGSSWTSGTSLPGARQFHGGTGPQTDHLVLGGFPGVATSTLEYNGSAWTSGGNSNENFVYYGLAGGATTSAIAFYGATDPAGTPNRSTGEEYNGTAWTTVVPSLPDQRNSGVATGTATAALFAGNGTTVTSWDGTTLTNETAMTTPRGNSFIGGTSASGVISGGSAPGSTTAVEEYDRAPAIKTLTTS